MEDLLKELDELIAAEDTVPRKGDLALVMTGRLAQMRSLLERIQHTINDIPVDKVK